MTQNLTDNRQNDLFLTVNRQRDPPPPPIENLEHLCLRRKEHDYVWIKS